MPNKQENPLARELLEVQRTLGWMDLVIGSLSDAVFVTDSSSHLIFANQHFADILSVPRVFLYGQKLKDVFDIQIDRKATEEHGYLPTAEYPKNGIYTWENGSSRTVFKISCRTLPTNNQNVYLAQDITHDMELSDMKNSFINLASHQLRTPMTSIMLQSHMLRDSSDFTNNPQGELHLNNIIKASERMINLISEILNITKIQNGSIEYTKRDKIDLHQAIVPLKEDLEIAAKAKKISLTFELPDKNIVFASNKAALNEVLSSLLVNAIQYTLEDGSVCLLVSISKTSIIFKVSDTGIGIPKNTIPFIFDQFTRADNALLTHNEGTGLGLYLVKMLAHKLGATIVCESEVDKGTTFTVTLPYEK